MSAPRPKFSIQGAGWLTSLSLGVQAFFQSLSLSSASLLVAVISGVAAVWIGRIGSAVARWFTAVLFPFVLSYSVYWMPVWLGADGSEYLAWVLLGVGVPFLAGLIPSVVVTFVITRYANRAR
jgi:hypothetical protein